MYRDMERNWSNVGKYVRKFGNFVTRDNVELNFLARNSLCAA